MFIANPNGGKRITKEFFRKLMKVIPDDNVLINDIIKFSITLSKSGLFVESRDLTRLGVVNFKSAKLLKEAARVSSAMQSYNDALHYLEDAAKIELFNNAETYSDMARCIYLYQDKDRNKTEGMKYVDKALKIDKNCANAWLNKGNI